MRVKVRKHLNCRKSDNKNRDSIKAMHLGRDGSKLTNQKTVLFQTQGQSCDESVTVLDGERMC